MSTQLSLQTARLILVAGTMAAAVGCSAEAAPVSGTGGGGSSGSSGSSGGGNVSGAGNTPGVGGAGNTPGVGGAGNTPGVGGAGNTPGVGGSGALPGTGGGSATTDCNMSPASGGPPLIDDLQDADNAIEKTMSGRTGWWYTFDDCPPSGSGMCPPGTTFPTPDPSGSIALVPEADPDDAANLVVHTTGSGHTEWGSGLGVGLRAGTSNKCLFDASTFTGISFRIKGTGTVRLKLPVPATMASADSALGTCSTNCYDDFGVSITLGAAWATKTYSWADLTQEGWGTPATFAPAQLTDIQWQVSSTSAAPASYDFYIDDLQFTQ